MATDEISFFAELKRRNVYRVGIAYIIVGWLALQALDIVVPIMRAPEWFSQLVLVLLVIGLPFALIFAWAYEMTPEGLKLEKDVDRTESITQETGQRINKITTTVLVFAVGILLVDKFMFNDPAVEPVTEPAATSETVAALASETPSIAVLPFVNMSADKNSQYFSDGLADTLLHMLAQIREIRVAARTSSFQFRDQQTDISDIAAQLKVGTVLEGSVQRAGNKVRVTAQLIEAKTGYHLWSGNYDRDMDDIFGIQDEIATEVVAALKVSLLGEDAERLVQRDTDNLDAYNAFLKAQSEIAENTYESLQLAEENLIEAIGMDPNYALAFSRLAFTYSAMAATGLIGISEMTEKGRPAAERALQLDPDLSEALALLGWIEYQEDNKTRAEDLLLRAISTGANDVVAMEVYAAYLQAELRLTEAAQLLQAISELDPLSIGAARNLQIALLMDRQFDVAADVAKRVEVLEPGSNGFFNGVRKYVQGDWALGALDLAAASRDDPNDPEGAFMTAVAFLNMDLLDEAEEQFGIALSIDPDHPVSNVIPLVLDLYRGDIGDESVRIARKTITDKMPSRLGSRGYALQVLTNHAVANGTIDAALATIQNSYPSVFDDDTQVSDNELDVAFYVGRALLRNGQTDDGQKLLRTTHNAALKFSDAFGVSEASVASLALSGDRNGALQRVKLLDVNIFNFRKPWTISLRNNSDFDSLRDDPVFVAKVAEFQNKADEQRALYEEMTRE